ncbi:phosphopantetheine-binding protein, partial [Mycobacterium marinum]|uniref:phosphopantetheine-binding protein n=1 Tax=Mycobacterium marinum TaxID=1781 RepID=UPI003BF5146C
MCGRIKDLLILAGRNIYPQDIEDSLRDCHPAIRPGGFAAFAVADGNSETLAVLAEVRTDGSPDLLAGVVAAIRAAVLKDHQLRCGVVVLGPPGSVSKTTSGKVQRSRCRARFLDGTLQAQALLVDRRTDDEPVGAAPRTEQLLSVVCGQAAEVLGIGAASVDIDRSLGDQGLNSIGVTELASRLSQVLGQDVQPVDIFNHPTVGDLVQILSLGEKTRHQRRVRERLGHHAASDAGAVALPADPVAIVGIGCRFPGGVDSADSLWDMVVSARDVISDFP